MLSDGHLRREPPGREVRVDRLLRSATSKP
jgi:hypothetical protein